MSARAVRCPETAPGHGHPSAWTGLLSWPRVDSPWTAIEDSCPRGQWGVGT